MKCKIGGREVELSIEGRVQGGVDSRPKGRKVQRATDLSNCRPGQPRQHATSMGAGSAGSAPALLSPYRSKWEAAYAQHLEILKAAGEIVSWRYEQIRFLLPGTRNTYKPDFLVLQPHMKSLAHWNDHGTWLNNVEIHEVKGWSKNRREGITKFKTAAGLNTWASFYLVEWDRERNQWIRTPA